jgi:hypothetical protein
VESVARLPAPVKEKKKKAPKQKKQKEVIVKAAEVEIKK